jgi:hypothetical protein
MFSRILRTTVVIQTCELHRVLRQIGVIYDRLLFQVSSSLDIDLALCLIYLDMFYAKHSAEYCKIERIVFDIVVLTSCKCGAGFT